jgi:aminoglycoside N3'-acetyltransferase
MLTQTISDQAGAQSLKYLGLKQGDWLAMHKRNTRKHKRKSRQRRRKKARARLV